MKTQWFTVIFKVEHDEDYKAEDMWDTTSMFELLRERLRLPGRPAWGESKVTVEEVHSDTGASEVVLHAEGTVQRPR